MLHSYQIISWYHQIHERSLLYWQSIVTESPNKQRDSAAEWFLNMILYYIFANTLYLTYKKIILSKQINLQNRYKSKTWMMKYTIQSVVESLNSASPSSSVHPCTYIFCSRKWCSNKTSGSVPQMLTIEYVPHINIFNGSPQN